MTRLFPEHATAGACEIERNLAGLALALLLTAAPAAAQQHDEPTSQPAEAAAGTAHGDQTAAGDAHANEQHAGGEEHSGGEEHAESPWAFAGRVFNFALLAGTLVFLLRRPLAGHLANRQQQIRADLDEAERMKREAAQQMAEMEAKLKALPGELEAVKARGHEEIAAEERRIREMAEAERARLAEQAKRDIDQHVRLARRELVEHAASLAVDVAARRIKEHITDEDQVRLVDRYLSQVKPS